jgi:hypothetical protein
LEQPAAHRIEQSEASRREVDEAAAEAAAAVGAAAAPATGAAERDASAGSISEHDAPMKPREHAHLPRLHTPFPWQPSGHARPEQSAP